MIIYPRMKTVKTAVLGGVNFAQATAMLGGIYDYARNKPDWEIIPLHYSQESALNGLIAEGRIDGLIGEMISDRWIKSLPRNHPIQIVNTSALSSLISVSSVLPDDIEIGKLAAKHFIRRNYTSLFYAGIHSYACSRTRLAGFKSCASEHNIEAAPLPRVNLTSPLQEWLKILKDAPKPLGLFCIDDHTARRIIEECRHTKLKIPDEISIIGVGNSQLDSFFAGIGISSVNIPRAAIGHRAARLLDRHLNNKSLNAELIKILPEGITLRETTGTGALNTITGRAINYIEANLSRAITVNDLAKHTHASRRLLELRFRESLGRSPHAEITYLRMTKARHLLRSRHIKISEIATQCGYPEMSHFYARFKQHHNGIPPAKWRKMHAAE